jgi:hypothetical protein
MPELSRGELCAKENSIFRVKEGQDSARIVNRRVVCQVLISLVTEITEYQRPQHDRKCEVVVQKYMHAYASV